MHYGTYAPQHAYKREYTRQRQAERGRSVQQKCDKNKGNVAATAVVPELIRTSTAFVAAVPRWQRAHQPSVRVLHMFGLSTFRFTHCRCPGAGGCARAGSSSDTSAPRSAHHRCCCCRHGRSQEGPSSQPWPSRPKKKRKGQQGNIGSRRSWWLQPQQALFRCSRSLKPHAGWFGVHLTSGINVQVKRGFRHRHDW